MARTDKELIKFKRNIRNQKNFELTQTGYLCYTAKWTESANTYKLKLRNENVSTKAWKCYRCNLTFTDEYHASLHEDLSKHNVREIEMVKV